MKDFILSIYSAVKIVLVICIVSILIELFVGNHFSWEDLKISFFFNFYYGMPLALLNGLLFDYLNRMFPWDKVPRKRAILGFVVTVIMNLVIVLVLNILYFGLYLGNGVASVFDAKYSMYYLIALIITIIISLFFHSVGFFKKAEEEKLKGEVLRKEVVSAELNALKAQLDPHFLFNSFNVLSGLIDEDKDKAQKFLGGLTKIYRYVLENRNEDLTNIADELSFADQYMNLQLARFEEGLELKIDIPEQYMSRKLPALSLQLLLENAIKHNAFDEEQPLNIDISVKDGNIVVKNNKRERTNLAGSNGLGLENIASRYKLHNIEGFKTKDSENYFEVELPIL
jgi:sensor histidine kinase YesM